ncbi:MAG TPA: glutamate synthase large subunit [Spirochaetota bacterium]|nr:glutamate synthase large subunit [Spirochaetota bacterium]HPC39851.1 glutamate synthase large subunit [Spirochaetota bacterium]HPL16473.1 glutamate synthase large subunit [Spirochaetota bacterium]HQF08973.1 glutamate synthase large subunit [Spirochaetota bacterium]HQH98781.1 glutamate synthase large subunit [Spirochaetota bacterium]
MTYTAPEHQGLYSSAYEHDSCGIGFVANIKGKASHDIIERGLEVLERMEHRGAESADNKTGDGAGLLIQIPDALYRKELPSLPEQGLYGTGIVFLPRDRGEAEQCVGELERIIGEEGMKTVGWREVAVDNSVLGNISRASEPAMKQLFVAGGNVRERAELERRLYIIRKSAENAIRNSSLRQRGLFYIPSLSSRTIVYKGMLMPTQVRHYYRDLSDPLMESAVALVHSRFSTNTFPSWDLAQPFRMLAHNGEINTVKGNRFWMSARESTFASPVFGDEIKKLLPVIEPGKSDSASFDNALEMLYFNGRSLPHALMMLIPESWNEKNPIPEELKYFYEYHSTFMEPWDGPASMVFCDGRFVGGTLDRNGLRPSRYVITRDDLIVMGSEVGVQTFPPESIVYKGRLMPGKLLLVDMEQGRIIPDEEIKRSIYTRKPYQLWVQLNRVNLEDLDVKGDVPVAMEEDALHEMHLLHGYSREDIEDIITTMAETGQEPTGSMGTDTPLAVFSDKPQRLFNYFKQCFAQVTNPPIDPIREELVMTLTSYIGSQKNLLDETPEHCRMIKFKSPLFTNRNLETIRHNENPAFRSITLPMTFPVKTAPGSLKRALDRLCMSVEEKIDQGYSYIILSDRGADRDNAPIPSLLACAGVHHYLIRTKKRTRIGLIIETAEAREVMHFALLFGYGASAVNPYGAFATINDLVKKEEIKNLRYMKAEDNYIKAVNKGLLKVLSKMGTSTLRSYRGSQIFEAVGLGKELIETYFTGTDSRIGGIGTAEVEREVLAQHETAFLKAPPLLESQGMYQYRRHGERHAWNPETIHLLQWATRSGDYAMYKKFSDIVNSLNRRPHFIRGLFDFKEQTPIPIDEVENEKNILKRLTTGAMSFGSISKEAHETIAAAMNAIRGRSNSGEGGEDPERFTAQPDGTSTRSAIKQIASGRFGVTSNYLANADELQIKMAQGAKPGEGGQLPGFKVDKIIAKTRHSTPGVTLISPPPHHDIYSIEDLAQLIFDLKNANPKARISVKLVSESGVGTVAAGVAKAHADNILISGFEGGTGASPISSIRHAGLPWEIGLAETHQTLVMNDLRGRVRLQTDGQIKTGREIVIAALLGAEEFGFGTATLIVLGCVMMRKCHQNTCPVGVATQDPGLRKKFTGRPEHLINYFTFMAREVREIMAELGIRKFDDLVGRRDLLTVRTIDHWKAKTVDPSPLLYMPKEAKEFATHCVQDQIHKIHDVMDHTLIERSSPALERYGRMPVHISLPINNTNRSTGTMLSYEVSKRFGEEGLPDDTISCLFRGNAGQSFGAFLAKGITFRLEGDANDYLGKGLSGGHIIVVPPSGSTFLPEENIIIGNTVLYGATSGEAYIRGIAGERFAVRNSGAIAVVEGTGDHCAEYMTGGRIIVLGKVGRNFAAGMSGGIAYVLDRDGVFEYFCNKGMVSLSAVREYEDQEFIIEHLEKHVRFTGSTVARDILHSWYEFLPKFIKVLPLEYKRAMDEMRLSMIDEKLARIREEEQLGVTY